MTDEIFTRATRLMLLDRRPGRWAQQTPGSRWYTQHRLLTDDDLRAHLLGRKWVASRLPEDGLTDRLVIDLDCDAPEHVADRNRRYWAIRAAFGAERTPLVWRTPSVLGIRVAYRIPPTPMADLAHGARAEPSGGLVAEVLSAAGVAPEKGLAEIYPADNRADRQLLGGRMALLDPETLEPIPGTELGARPSVEALLSMIELVEEWYEAVDHGLLDHLRHTGPGAGAADADTDPSEDPAEEATDCKPVVRVGVGAVAGTPARIDLAHGTEPSPALARLVDHGLERPSSRYDAEFLVGQAMWLWPDRFADLGLPTPPTREDVARCLAEWLAARTNGLSREWAASLRRDGLEGAKREWVARYLQRNDKGEAPVDRMRNAAARRQPALSFTVHPTPEERTELLRIGRRALLYGDLRAQREIYAFEIWASVFLRFAKWQMRRGGASGDVERRTAQIAADWCEGFPYGRSYVRYRSILAKAGLLEVVKEAERPAAPDVPGRATVYRLPEVRWCRRRDLPMPAATVRPRIRSLKANDRPVTVDEIYHALHVVDNGIDAARIYGRRTAERIERYARAVRPPSPFAAF